MEKMVIDLKREKQCFNMLVKSQEIIVKCNNNIDNDDMVIIDRMTVSYNYISINLTLKIIENLYLCY